MSDIESSDDQPQSNAHEDPISDLMMERNAHELQRLAMFYHAHGYIRQAQEIFRSLLSIRQQMNDKTGS